MKQIFLIALLITFSMAFVSATHANTNTVISADIESTYISGKVIDGDGTPIIGATVMLKGTTVGTITSGDGSFSFNAKGEGSVILVVSFLGYSEQEIPITLDGKVNVGIITLKADIVGLKEVSIIASVAVDRKTPVAKMTIRGKEIEELVGNQEFPEVLKSTPSVYVTKQGGGFGDARINVRGFDQRNTAVMINGVPVNDMENGWVYWSNWAGLSDVTSMMQVQRGLGASKLAVSSVGGSINIITNAAKMEEKTSFGYGIGNDGYKKYSLMHSTGLTENGWAGTFQFTKASGDGYVDGTAFEAMSYFASISKNIGDDHQLSLTALGAPQWHNQRRLGIYDGVTNATMKEKGIRYNPAWGYLNGEEFSWRKNFYHKPKVFLNWYYDINDDTKLATTAYVSMGRGGGTGPRGKINGKYETSSRFQDINGQVRFDDIQRWNRGETVDGFGDPRFYTGYDPASGDSLYINNSKDGFVRRASMNSHNWYGAISNLTHNFNDNWTLVSGVDLRYYKGIHYRRIDNLLGADGYMARSDINNPTNIITQQQYSNPLGSVNPNDDDKLAYYNDGLVNWTGLYGQIEYDNNKLSAFTALSVSNQGFKRIDYFNYMDDDPEQETDWQNFLGGSLKAGANYNLTPRHNVFANAGYYSRQPNFDAVFINYVNQINPDAINEKVLGLEAGYGYRSTMFSGNLNLYRTSWSDRNLNRSVSLETGDGTANLSGIEQIHTGIEVDVAFKPISKLQLDGMLSVGNWTYGSDVTANVYDDDQNHIGTQTMYLDGVKVGDAAQTTARTAATYNIYKGINLYASYYYADNLYGNYNLAGKDFDEPGKQALKLPSYNLVDAGIRYNFKIGDKIEARWLFNVNNVFDTEYIAESETNYTDPGDFDRNIVYYGFGRTWNTSLKFMF